MDQIHASPIEKIGKGFCWFCFGLLLLSVAWTFAMHNGPTFEVFVVPISG